MPVHQMLGGVGKFEYTLTDAALNIVLPVAYTFLPGEPANQPGFARDEFTWPSSGDLQAEFIREFSRQVEEVWSGKFGIFGSALDPHADDDWWLQLNVNVNERSTDPIWRILVGKDPIDAISLPASVCGPGFHHAPGTCVANTPGDETGSLEISGSLVKPLEMLKAVGDEYVIWFKLGTSVFHLPDQLQVRFHDVINRLLMPNSIWSMRITGHSSADEINAAPPTGRSVHPAVMLARERASLVNDFFVKNGVPGNKITVSVENPFLDPIADPGYVDVIMSTQRQSTIAHEVGHLFGLGDEYANDPSDIGSSLVDTNYIQLIKTWGFDVPDQGPSRSIMSNGNTVLPRHYIPFLDLLAQNSPRYAWSLTPNP